jgi:hypothetical protein
MISSQINELLGALSKAQGMITFATKDSKNPFYNSKYADLSSVWTACRDALSSNGLSVIQTTEMVGDQLMLVTLLGHASGQWIKSHLPINISKEDELDRSGKPRKKNELHAMGSTLTYLRRYALSAIVGVSPDEDDDGNQGGQTYKPEPKQVAKLPDPQKQQEPVMTKQQIENLEEILKDNQEFKQEILSHYSKKGIKSLFEIPAKQYDYLMASAKKRNDEKFIQTMAN